MTRLVEVEIEVDGEPPETEAERADTEPPPSLISVSPPSEQLEAAQTIAELSSEASPADPLLISAREIPPPQSELIELWNSLGQLGVAFTELSTRVAKLERFLGVIPKG